MTHSLDPVSGHLAVLSFLVVDRRMGTSREHASMSVQQLRQSSVPSVGSHLQRVVPGFRDFGRIGMHLLISGSYGISTFHWVAESGSG